MSLSTIQKDLKKNPELLNKQRLNGENELLFRPEITVEELKFLKYYIYQTVRFLIFF